MNETLQTTITAIIARIPEWLRHDLVSKEATARIRAEETLSAMITNALTETENT